jgi:hypothetical protein
VRAVACLAKAGARSDTPRQPHPPPPNPDFDFVYWSYTLTPAREDLLLCEVFTSVPHDPVTAVHCRCWVVLLLRINHALLVPRLKPD